MPFLVDGFGVFLTRQYMLSIPKDLIDSARIDGASELRIFCGSCFRYASLPSSPWRSSPSAKLGHVHLAADHHHQGFTAHPAARDFALHEQLRHVMGSADGHRGPGNAADHPPFFSSCSAPSSRASRRPASRNKASMPDTMRGGNRRAWDRFKPTRRPVPAEPRPAKLLAPVRAPADFAAPICTCSPAASPLATCRGSWAMSWPVTWSNWAMA